MVSRKLSKNSSHRRAMLRNMVTELFRHEKIETTLPKAKEVSRKAEKLITAAQNSDINSRRRVSKEIQDKEILTKLFDEIAPRYSERPGGYTRVLKGHYRRGDTAEQALIELV
ncbi:MAG: 50S ribosomal protein L17 [Halanaerobiaceae bacterium]